MNKILLLIYFFSTYSFYAQSEASSFYFKSPQPLGIDSAFEFNENYIGSFYKANDSLVRVIIDRDSIFSEFIIMLTISQKELKKNKKLKLGDSLLFGVKENKGIPYMSLDDTIYAVMLQYELFFKADKDHVLKFKDDQYFLNSKNEKGFYSTSILGLKEDTLSILEIDHYESMEKIKKFKDLNQHTIDDIKIFLANPSNEELTEFILNNGFNDQIIYHK